MNEIPADLSKRIVRLPGRPASTLVCLSGVAFRLVYERRGQLGLYLIRRKRSPLLLDRITNYMGSYTWLYYTDRVPIDRNQTIDVLTSLGYEPSVLDAVRVQDEGRTVEGKASLGLGLRLRRGCRPEAVIYTTSRRTGHSDEPSVLSSLSAEKYSRFRQAGPGEALGWGLGWEHDARGGAWIEARVPYVWGQADRNQVRKTKASLVRMGFAPRAVEEAVCALTPDRALAADAA